MFFNQYRNHQDELSRLKNLNQSAAVGSPEHRNPDWLIRSYFYSRSSDNLHKDSHQKSWLHPRVKLNHTIVN